MTDRMKNGECCPFNGYRGVHSPWCHTLKRHKEPAPGKAVAAGPVLANKDIDRLAAEKLGIHGGKLDAAREFARECERMTREALGLAAPCATCLQAQANFPEALDPEHPQHGQALAAEAVWRDDHAHPCTCPPGAPKAPAHTERERALAGLVKRLARQLPAGHPTRVQATEYLQREGFFSLLRDEDKEPSAEVRGMAQTKGLLMRTDLKTGKVDFFDPQDPQARPIDPLTYDGRLVSNFKCVGCGWVGYVDPKAPACPNCAKAGKTPVKLVEGPARDLGQALDRFGEHLDRPEGHTRR